MDIKKKGKRIIAATLIVLVLISCAIGIYLYGIFHRITDSPVLANGSRDERWLSDLNFVKRELPEKHKNLFFSKSKADFNKEMDLLINNIKDLNDTEIKGELAGIINSVNDSHTSVDIKGALLYPFSFFEFEEGIYLSNAAIEYKDFWGKKLTVRMTAWSI